MFYQQNKKFSFQFNLVGKYQNPDNQSNSGPLFEQGDFLLHAAKINPQVQHFITEVSAKGEVLAHLYFQIMPFKGSELKSYIPQGEGCLFNKTMGAIVDLALERVNWNLAVLGNVFVTGDNGQYWKTDKLTDEVKWKIIEEASDFLSAQFKFDALLISDLREEDLAGHERILSSGYRLFEVEPDLIFDIDPSWYTFNDYLSSIVSKYRIRTKKVLKNGTKLSVKDLDLPNIQNQEKEIYQLYKNVMNNAPFKLAEINNFYFQNFKKAYPKQFFVRGFYLDEKLVGLISYFEDTECLHLNFIGLDYSLNREYSIYQRILYDAIEQGILAEKKQIHFGRTASEIKTSVGAKPVKAYSFLKHNNKIPNLAIRPLTSYLKPEPFEVRHPFKSEQKTAL